MSNPNPDEQLRDLNLLNLCNCDGFWHVEGEDGVSRYLDDIVEALIKEREELARIDELTKVKVRVDSIEGWAIRTNTTLINRIAALKGGKK